MRRHRSRIIATGLPSGRVVERASCRRLRETQGICGEVSGADFVRALIDVLDAVEFGDVGCAGPLGAFGAESAIRMVLRGNKPRARPRFRAHGQRGRRRVSDSVPVRGSRSSLDSSLDCGPDGRWRVGNEEISWGESVFVSACEEGAALRSAVLRSFGPRREVAHIRRSGPTTYPVHRRTRDLHVHRCERRSSRPNSGPPHSQCGNTSVRHWAFSPSLF